MLFRHVDPQTIRVEDEHIRSLGASTKKAGVQAIQSRWSCNVGSPAPMPGIPQIHDPRQSVPLCQTISYQVTHSRRGGRNDGVEIQLLEGLFACCDGGTVPARPYIRETEPCKKIGF